MIRLYIENEQVLAMGKTSDYALLTIAGSLFVTRPSLHESVTWFFNSQISRWNTWWSNPPRVGYSSGRSFVSSALGATICHVVESARGIYYKCCVQHLVPTVRCSFGSWGSASLQCLDGLRQAISPRRTWVA